MKLFLKIVAGVLATLLVGLVGVWIYLTYFWEGLTW